MRRKMGGEGTERREEYERMDGKGSREGRSRPAAIPNRVIIETTIEVHSQRPEHQKGTKEKTRDEKSARLTSSL